MIRLSKTRSHSLFLTSALALTQLTAYTAAAPQCDEQLLSPVGGLSSFSGEYISTDGTRVIASERFDQVYYGQSIGASIYHLVGGVWTEEALLSIDAPGSGTQIEALSVEIQGSHAAMGYRLSSSEGFIAIFELGASGWALTQTIETPASATSGDFFGSSVFLHGNQLLASRFIYQLGASGYEPFEVLFAPQASSTPRNDHWSVMDDDWIVIGDPGSNMLGVPISGRVHVLRRQFHGGVWEQELLEPTPNGFAQFGCSVALEGDWIVAGAQEYGEPGRVQAFQYDGSEWVHRQEITNPYPPTVGPDRFGTELVLSNGRLAASRLGATNFFELVDGVWTHVGDAPGSSNGSVDMVGDTVIHGHFWGFQPAAPSVGTFFGADQTPACAGTPNSTGSIATLELSGSARTSVAGLVARVTDAPADTVGIFVYGGAVGSVLVGNGELCIDPSSGITRYPGIVQLDSNGAVNRVLDAGQLDAGTTGSSAVLQLWFRDQVGAGSDLSSAVSITLCD